MNPLVFLINLDGSDVRMRAARDQLRQAKIDFVRVSAFDGRGKTLNDFDCVDHKRMAAYLGKELCGGEIGCYLSHVDCARKFLATDAKICVILEDDFLISFPSFLTVLSDAVTALPIGWHVINFGNHKNKIYSHLKRYAVDERHTSLVKAHYFPMTTTGICWSREGAQAFLKNAFPIFCSVDRFLRHWQTRQGKGYCFIPSLVTTTTAVSDIDRPLKTKEVRQLRERIKTGLKKQRNSALDKIIAYTKKMNHERF